ncbi:OmpA family protein [Oceaniglobus ichthyenteri]|uniref:OmpA family protein n=1 Tax=Oceaniglobus ichthyenteri TaxID=2136177 RepID=UPI000D398A6E|nr:OmpA family protein [Oceaniglobus ichthyenteri]
MKISNIISTATAGVFALGMSVSAAAAESCVIVLPFEFNSAAVSTINKGLLDVIRAKYNGTTVDLAGHTDAVGSAAVNLNLSKRRAQTVDDYLTNGTSITVNNVTGFGKSQLKVADSGPNQLNRRVEVTVYDCNAADFNGRGDSLGSLGNAGTLAALVGGILIIGAIGDGSSSTTTTTTTSAAAGSGVGNK